MSRNLVEWNDNVESKCQKLHKALSEVFEECIAEGISPEEFHYLAISQTHSIIAKHLLGQRIGKVPKD